MAIERIIGVHSPLEARIVEHMGGAVLWVSGYSVSAACFGLPDLDLIKPHDKLRIVERIADATTLRMIVDADGGLENQADFAAFLEELSRLGIDAVCVEDEQIPKTSALYPSDVPLLSPDEFYERIRFVVENSDLRVIARTNAIVRGHTTPEITDRLKLVNSVKGVSAIALHGSNIQRISSIISEFPDTKFYLITTLLKESDLGAIEKMPLAGLIFGHDMLFASVLEQSKTARRIMQMGLPLPTRKAASDLVDALVGYSEKHSQIEEEMKLYYADRAPEYDDWYDRLNAYEKSPKLNQMWFDDLQTLERVLKRISGENILELGAGTGRWSKLLLERNTLTATDAAEEMLEINRLQTGVRGRLLDIFLDPPRWLRGQYTACFFSFLISHIPPSRMKNLIAVVDAALPMEGGRIVIVDSYYNPTELNCLSHKDDIQIRALKDGRSYRVYKHYYTQAELEAFANRYLEKWSLSFTENYFFVLDGKRSKKLLA